MSTGPLSLCLLNYEYPPIGGGAASATYEMARALARLGHKVTVVTAAFGNLTADETHEGVRTMRLPCRRRRADHASLPEMFSFVRSAWQRLPDIVRAARCDGIICFFALPCGPAAWHTWKETGIPYVISLRGGDVPGLVPSIDWIHRLLRPLRRSLLRSAVSVVANSEGLKQLSVAADPVPVAVIPNGVNTQRFRARPAQADTGIFRVLSVGRLQEQKNNAFALQVIAQAKTLISATLEYHIVGDGPFRAMLEDLANNLGLRREVIWHGWVARDELPEIYRSCDCFFHPTLYEGLPNVVLEAMAAGLPVVASDVPGNSDLVQDGATGYVRRLGDESGFAEAIARLAGNADLRHFFGAEARRTAEYRYSWDSVSARYADIFALACAVNE